MTAAASVATHPMKIDHDDSDQHEQRCGQSLAAADLCRHRLIQGRE